MTNNWQKIWNNRTLTSSSLNPLGDLMKMDGFDILGHINENAWRNYVKTVSQKLAITAQDSIFEVGCGAGAFLYPFFEQGHQVGGIDYADNLLSIAQEFMPGNEFEHAEASALNIKKQYDYVIANGVFLYFGTYDYAERVLQQMLTKAKKGIAILDTPDQATQALALIARKQGMGEAEYAERYQGLDHLYFSRSWFQAALKMAEISIKIEQQNITGYLHNPYRFNVFIKKD